jgi:hypothetical protein
MNLIPQGLHPGGEQVRVPGHAVILITLRGGPPAVDGEVLVPCLGEAVVYEALRVLEDDGLGGVAVEEVVTIPAELGGRCVEEGCRGRRRQQDGRRGVSC